jgi:3D-(3,5/4)-trihydroxycyclohexane-1,2-dione acylhydrolase (decyclizing)
MLNSEIATSVRLGLKLIIVLLDNGGFGCIERLQRATGNASFNNLLTASGGAPGGVDFLAHARSLGADAREVKTLAALEDALVAVRKSDRTTVLLIETDPAATTTAGGHWWDVAVPEVSERTAVREAHERYLRARRKSREDGS